MAVRGSEGAFALPYTAVAATLETMVAMTVLEAALVLAMVLAMVVLNPARIVVLTPRMVALTIPLTPTVVRVQTATVRLIQLLLMAPCWQVKVKCYTDTATQCRNNAGD